MVSETRRASVRFAPATAIAVMGAAVLVALALILLHPGAAVGADPSPVPGQLFVSGDLRSEGSGPGLVGSPIAVLLAVVLLGVATAAVTAVLARLSQRR